MKRLTEKTLYNLIIEVYHSGADRDILNGYTNKQLTKLKEQLEGPEVRNYTGAQITMNLPGFTQEARYNRMYSWRARPVLYTQAYSDTDFDAAPAKEEIVYQAGTILKNLIVVEIRTQKLKQIGL